jgi:hypothetical protein
LSSLLSVTGGFPGVCFTVAGGNEGNAKRHFYSQIDKEIGYKTVELNIGEEEKGFSMEIWGAAPGSYSISIISPSGEQIQRIEGSLFVIENHLLFLKAPLFLLIINSRNQNQVRS